MVAEVCKLKYMVSKAEDYTSAFFIEMLSMYVSILYAPYDHFLLLSNKKIKVF